MDELKKELDAKNFPSDPEHCVIHAMFPQQLEAHLKGTNKPKPVVKPADTPKAPAEAEPAPSAASSDLPGKRYSLTVDGKRVEVGVEEIE